MTKQELEKAIENGESVWVANKYCIPYEVNLTNNHYIDTADNKESLMLAHIDDVELIDYLEYVFETKEKAQHYHYHANITRTEELPFFTWEEFKGGKEVIFKGYNGRGYALVYNKGLNKIDLFDTDGVFWGIVESWRPTEENFYKAYDECVRLFKGEE